LLLPARTWLKPFQYFNHSTQGGRIKFPPHLYPPTAG
jgi:hypothetical protein